MSGNSSRPTVFLAKRASTSDADGPKAFPYQVYVRDMVRDMLRDMVRDSNDWVY